MEDSSARMCLSCNKIYRGKSAGSSLRSHRFRVHVKKSRKTTIVEASSWQAVGSFLRCSTTTQATVSHEPEMTARYEDISEDEAESLPASQSDQAWWTSQENQEQSVTTECSTSSETLPACSQNPDSEREFEEWLDEILSRPDDQETVHRQSAASNQPRSDDFSLGSDKFRVDSCVLREVTQMAVSAIALEFLQERIQRRWGGCPEWVGRSVWEGMHAAPGDDIIVIE